MSRPGTLHVLTPTFRPVGGVVKIMDYVTHARSAGYEVAIRAPQRPGADEALFAIERFRGLREDPGVSFHTRKRIDFGEDDLAFVSLPGNFELPYNSLPSGMSPERIIHIIQNVRHVNPRWLGGYPVRLLTRPAARISINDIVADLIRPYLDPRGLHRVINLGHALDYFAHERSGGLSTPVRVAYTTWKSDLGDRVAATLPEGFEFRAIRETVDWAALRELYHWAAVFVSSPGPEEGLYLPGLEAMAAGALVVTPDVGGNMAYCRPEDNCLLVGFEDVDGYRDALLRLAGADAAEVERLRTAGYATTADFDLDAERRGFHDFLDEVWQRVDAYEGRPSATA